MGYVQCKRQINPYGSLVDVPRIRQLPHNIDAEMAVLGNILMTGRIPKKIAWLRAEHFVLNGHRLIFEALRNRTNAGQVADPVTMKEVFADEALAQDGGVNYLHRLCDCAATPLNAVEYGRLLVDLFIRRELIVAGEDITSHNFQLNGGNAPQNLVKALSRIEALRETIPAATAATVEQVQAVAAKEFPVVHELVPGLVCPGLTLLCAKPKVGKSWMLLECGLAIASGGVALGQLRCIHSQALLVMLEDSERRIAFRARALRPDGIPNGCLLATSWPRGELGIARLDATLDEYPEVRFIGIDVLAAFRDVPKDNGGGYQADYESVAGLQKLAQRRGIAVVLVHHLRKADGDDPLDLVSGTLGLTGAADHVIVITGNQELGYKLTLRGRDLPDAAWDLGFDRGIWTVLGDSAPKRKRMDTVDRLELKNQVRSALAKGVKQKDIAAALGCGTATVNRLVKELADEASSASNA